MLRLRTDRLKEKVLSARIPKGWPGEQGALPTWALGIELCMTLGG